MLGFLLRRTAAGGSSPACAVLTLVFCIVRILPGDPAQVILGDFASQPRIEALRKRLGLDRPIWVQYVDVPAQARDAATGASRWSPAAR